MIDAITNAINNHPETAITALFSIFGAVIGFVVNAAIEQWRNSGRIEITLVEDNYSFGTPHGPQSYAEGAHQIDFDLGFRVLNTYAEPKSIALLSVQFFQSKDATEPVLEDPFRMMGSSYGNLKANEDVQLPSRCFARAWVHGAGVKDAASKEERLEAVKSAKWMRVRFLVSPKKVIDFWHEIKSSR
jgi:hypothetical protein